MALALALQAWDTPTTSAEGARRYDEIARATEIAQAHLYPRDVATSHRSHDTPNVAAAFAVLRSAGKLPELHQDFTDVVESRFYLVRQDIARYFAALKETTSISAHPNTSAIMVELLERLSIWQRVWGLPLRAFEDPKIMNSFTTHFQHLVYASLPASFPEHLRFFLQESLAGLPRDEEGKPRKKQKVAAPSPHLHRLTVLPRYATTLMRVAYDEIEKIAKEETGMGWEERRLARARQRVSDTVVNWISGVFETNSNPQDMLRSMYSRFDYYLCKSFFEIRTEELFDIIVDFPDSLAALEDLRDCLIKVDQRDQLVDRLRAANLKRLLHPGAETKDVITQYISTIRCLRIIDPLGVLLHKVAEPLRRHLRDRPDTIRCIVATLVEGEELQDENDPASAEPLAQTNDPTVEKFWDPKWEPEPNDAAPEFRTGKTADIVGTLVSIYETREVIVKELQAYLATRLLAIGDYDAVKEVRTIELLKIRFGEEALHVCDVMLKDMADSKRIDDHVHGDIESIIHPLIISRMFWPNLHSSSLHLTPKLEQVQSEYETAFHHFKPDKRLRWLQEMGKVTITLELEDREVTAEATPLQAAVAELFEGKARWSEEDLGDKLGVDGVPLRNALAHWVGYGVLKEDDDGMWRLLEVVEEAGEKSYIQEAPAPLFKTVDEGRAQRVQIYWSYIKGMLSNLGPQNIDTLQKMLSMMKDYDGTRDELAMFMAAAKREGQVEQRGNGTWVLM
ncbi:Anaphase-promoting complex subunit 2 [Vanrija pseudolonga]|uniref:Anaphase-promoting complex subunit 2 n=1 Tax=Vanrija pseudolonga TaxID=143232 RepID=A0AAF0YFY0_9TREE|nr:Anaphase-promoting complex subunit 2 [Vanrija pseudolonga]